MNELIVASDEQRSRLHWEAALAELTPKSLASIVYTSGTTAEPRGVMLTQGNLAANAQGIVAGFGNEPGDLRLNSLPFSHAYGRMSDLYVSLAGGTDLALGFGREFFLADAQRLKPTLLVVVPLQLVRIQQAAVATFGAGDEDAVQKLLGGRLRGFICGGAALDGSLVDYFASQGTPVYEGYGLTEATPVISLSSPKSYRRGSVGRLVPGTTAKLAPDEELLIQGPQVMAGYWRDDEASRATLEDGWLHTGDLAHIDADGYLFLQGRKREYIALASGKKVWPAAIEGRFAQDAVIEQIMVVGEGERCLGALVVPRKSDTAGLDSASSPANMLHYLADRLRDRADHEQIRRLRLLSTPWSADRDELTPKLTVRRQVIAARNAALIKEMFEEDEPH